MAQLFHSVPSETASAPTNCKNGAATFHEISGEISLHESDGLSADFLLQSPNTFMTEVSYDSSVTIKVLFAELK
jgi:hypothetical protein